MKNIYEKCLDELQIAEKERDKWHQKSLSDERCFIREEISYQRGKINTLRHILSLIENSNKNV